MRNFLIMLDRFIDLKIALAVSSTDPFYRPILQAKLDEQRTRLMQLAEEMDTKETK